MVERLVSAAVRFPLIVLGLVLGLIGAGAYSYSRLDVEAYPNPVPPMIEVIAQPNGLSAEEVEKYVTIPLEIALAGIPGLDHTRSQSLFGLSDVKIYFKWSADYEKARQEVINRLQFVDLPPGVQTSLSPWSATGEIFRFTVEGPYSLREKKTALDWVIAKQLQQVPGVLGVTSFGGETKQYQVSVDPVRLRAYGATLPQVMTALASANQAVGGQRLTVGAQSYDVRGLGLLIDAADIENVVIAQKQGTPVRIKDVAEVKVGAAPRLGTIGKDDDDDVVQGTILMRHDASTKKTLEAAHERLETIKKNRLLPPGMEVRPYYDRGELVGVTTHTVTHNLVVGMALVAAILFVFLGNFRAATITALVIPLSLLVAFCGLVATHTSANLISLGAIDFGIVVDSAVIMTENVFRQLGPHGRGTMKERVVAAAREVGGPMAFSTGIIGVSLLPLFTMTGVSGVIFAPMALTYAFAIGGAIVLSLTLAPALSSKLLRADEEEKEGLLMRVLDRIYAPLIRVGVGWPKLVVAVVAAMVLGGVVMSRHLGGEFMPKLEEGNLWIRATLPSSISREESSRYADRMRAIVRGCPAAPAPCTRDARKHLEIVAAISQVGRPDDGTDVTGFNNVEIFAPLLPFDQWERGRTKEDLTRELGDELEAAFPGVVFNFSQMIGDNVEEAVAGVKGENAVKVFGPDVAENEKTAEALVDAMGKVPGVDDLGWFKSLGQPSVRIVPNREACARYGLNTGDVMAIVEAALGGRSVTRVYEGEKSFALTVRFQPEYRATLGSIRELDVSTSDGSHVPLGQLARVEVGPGAMTIYREDGQRYTPAKFSVRGRDLVATVADAQRTVGEKVRLPYGSFLEWSGELNELRNAQARLAIVVPVTLLVVILLSTFAVRSKRGALVVLTNVPVACVGGVIALFLAKIHLSVSAAMGFVSLLGIAAQDGILVVTYFNRLVEDGMAAPDAARQAVQKRLRATLMTSSVAVLGLVPAAISHGIGSETQKPLALVVIGGSLLLAITARAFQPAMLVLVSRLGAARRATVTGPAAPEPPVAAGAD